MEKDYISREKIISIAKSIHGRNDAQRALQRGKGAKSSPYAKSTSKQSKLA